MDFSINKVNLKNNINFKGIEGAYNEQTVPIYKFYAPAHTKDEKVFLEFVIANKDPKTAEYKIARRAEVVPFGESDLIELPQEVARSLSSGFAYRYQIRNTKTNEVTYKTDSFKTIDIDDKGNKMNIIEQGRSYGISPKGGSMRHSFLDSDVRLGQNGKKAEINKEFVRNHFNKLGGSIAGLKWLLENTNELDPYRYFMTTPDIGVDKVSSHRYWPSNHYQCSDYETFKDFNLKLFEEGKGYVADGAFTSQGLQSPLVQHVLKWGEQSPFYNMLKIDGRLALGVLPDRDLIDGVNPYEHIGVRLVNPKGENYDKTKPTYIQFYDDRMLSEGKIEDGQLHFDYDKAPTDHYEITTHQDSVQPYAFEIDPNDKKLKEFGNKKAILLKDIKNIGDFLTFPNFSIAEKNKVAGATYWDGNVDIIKMNLSNPENTEENREGCRQAREYLLGVASYWTEAIQSHLILQTAKAGVADKVLQKNGIKEVYPDIVKSIRDNTFASLVLGQGKQTEEYVRNFPLQSLETSEELSAIFAQPQFADELYARVGEEVVALFDSVLDEAIPKNKRNEDYRAYVAKTYANDILRSIYAYALNPNAVNEAGKIDTKELNKVTLKSIESGYMNSPEEERKQVISAIDKGLSTDSVKDIVKVMQKDLAKISLEEFKTAEAVVLQGKGGLNWRFDAAKDIGDLDSVRDKGKTFDQIWNGDKMNPGVQDFWGDFVSRIKQSNPAAYVINEVTSLGDFMDDSKKAEFDRQLAAAWEAAGKPEAYETKPVYAKQVQFLNETNSTTTSEYSKGFNSFSMFAGVNPEKEVKDQGAYDGIKKNSGRVSKLRDQMESLMKYNQPNPVLYSHMFVSNHDKPSVLHTLPLNMSIYMAQDLNNVTDEDKAAISRLTGGANLNHLCPKAVGVGLVMSKTIDKLNYSDKDKEKLKESLRNLVLGKKDSKSEPSYKRAESFGVKPYEITIKDVIKNAGIVEEKELDKKTLEFHYAMMKDSMILFERMWQAMNACIGVPTLYGGNEFVQTGYETPSKNVYLGIRNEVLHGLQEDKNYGKYFDKMHQISGMYQKKGLGVLRDGAPVSLQITSERAIAEDAYAEQLADLKEKAKAKGVSSGAFNYFVDQVGKHKDLGFDKAPSDYEISADNTNHSDFKKVRTLVQEAIENKEVRDALVKDKDTDRFELWPIYRKNAKGEQAISIITNLGMPDGVASWQYKPKEHISKTIESISILDKEGRCPFAEGTKLVKVGYGNKADENGYIVKNGKIVKEHSSTFKLDDTVSVFIPKK